MNKFLSILSILAAIGVAGIFASEADGSQKCSLPTYRLPTHVQAKHYELHIEPSLKKLEFNGRVQIELLIDGNKRENDKIGSNRNQILLHSDKGITLVEKSIRFVIDGDHQVDVINVCRDSDYQLVMVTLAEDLPEQLIEAKLSVSFFGPLRDDMFGFYQSSYFSEDKQKHYLATTQFESTEARKAFPCLDEPSFKATFDVTIVHEPEVIALSNTGVIEEKVLKDGRTMVKFARTPPMSTYLLAYVVGKFEFIERVILNGRLRIRVYGTPGESHKGEFALDTACRAIQLMEEYFGIEFPLNKMDLIGIPDFFAGAMENWGLITFREVFLQVDESYSTLMDMAQVGEIVIHELAHQWFGNLVTMRWWNDLWLNEGFATWMSYHILEQVHPQFAIKHIFLMRNHIQALENDAKSDTHAIRDDKVIETNEQILQLFDNVYEKSASVLSFIHNDYLGPELFKESLRHYMAKHKYGNTVTDDLCASMEEVSKIPVKPILYSWTTQPGHPMLTVEHLTESNTLSIVQNRFMSNLELVERLELDQKWLIPISMVVVAPGREEKLEFTINVDEQTTSVQLPNWFEPSQQGHWLKINHDFSGLYRVNYPSQLFALLEEPIKTRKMSPADRLNVLEDVKALWTANLVPSDKFVEILSWFVNEDHGAVLESLVLSLRNLKLYVKSLMNGDDIDYINRVHIFMVKMLGQHLENPIFTNLKASVDQIDEHGLAKVLELLISIDHEQACEVALNLYSSANGDVTKIRVSLRQATYLAVTRSGSEEQHDELIELLTKTKSRLERNRLIVALAKSSHLHRQQKLAAVLKTSFHELKVDMSLADILQVMTDSVPNTKPNDFVPLKLVAEEKIREKKASSPFKILLKPVIQNLNNVNKRLFSGPLKAIKELFGKKKKTKITSTE